MMVMLSNYGGVWPGYLSGRYPGRIGHLYSPGGQRGPWPFLPYALDNGRFAASQTGEWSELEFKRLLAFAHGNSARQCPLWAAVPDVVADREGTLRDWKVWAPQMKKNGFILAFVVQDGMESSDVPEDASVVFVGGSTEWKWGTLARWVRDFPRVHVGRVNSPHRLYHCEALGVESVDGTGWLRGGPESNQFQGLLRYLEDSRNGNMRVLVQEDMLV